MKSTRKLLLSFLIFTAIFAKAEIKAPSGQVDINFYVSLNGNDKNNGSLTNPFKSIKRALSNPAKFRDKNVKILLRGGKYYLDQTVILSSEDLHCRSLKIENYKEEKVIISAGRRLSLKWEVYRNGIYQAKVPAGSIFERLYANGSAQPMARYPNFDPKAKVFNGSAADAISPERVSRWKNPAGGYVHALHSGEWGSWDYLITGKNQDNVLELKGGWQNNRPSKMHTQFRFVEHIFEELDAPGEWFLERTSNVLYYYPANGLDLDNTTIEIAKLKNSIELKGTVAKPIRNVEIKGLDFAHNERTFMETKEPLLRSDWTIYRGGAILFDGTENCKITNCSFTGLGGNAIMLSNYNAKDVVSGCYVAHIGASAVCFVGSPKAVRSPLFNYNESMSYAKLDKTAGPLTNDYPRECTVTDNLFHHLGEIEKQATGVEISMAESITVTHNSIYNTPRAGINIGDGTWGGHVIAYNDVFNTVMETGDHGAFNSWGRDRFWDPKRGYMDSLAKVHSELILLDAQKQTVIHNNRFRCDHGWDIDLDDGSSNYHIYNNVCLNGGLKLREGFYRIVENNIMVNNSFHPHVWFANSGDVFERNIISTKYYPIRVADWGKRIDYNFFIDPDGLATARKNGTDPHSLSGEALFTDQRTGNYTVSVNSAALMVGFKNFPMNQFGVKKPSLKKIAEQPIITPMTAGHTASDKSAVIPFLGGKIKSVDGIGDRSAYGLPDETGVIVIEAGLMGNSLLAQSGLRSKDVIRTVQGKNITNVHDLEELTKSAQKNAYTVKVEIMREQKTYYFDLKVR